mmetsp:Transcript_27262/g.76515  ORF Transcript_27262/g.76515 Transcript_27262/m.76515 type:complete len:239 (-) Transcript_27262:337-1053(-)
MNDAIPRGRVPGRPHIRSRGTALCLGLAVFFNLGSSLLLLLWLLLLNSFVLRRWLALGFIGASLLFFCCRGPFLGGCCLLCSALSICFPGSISDLTGLLLGALSSTLSFSRSVLGLGPLLRIGGGGPPIASCLLESFLVRHLGIGSLQTRHLILHEQVVSTRRSRRTMGVTVLPLAPAATPATAAAILGCDARRSCGRGRGGCRGGCRWRTTAKLSEMAQATTVRVVLKLRTTPIAWG